MCPYLCVCISVHIYCMHNALSHAVHTCNQPNLDAHWHTLHLSLLSVYTCLIVTLHAYLFCMGALQCVYLCVLRYCNCVNRVSIYRLWFACVCVGRHMDVCLPSAGTELVSVQVQVHTHLTCPPHHHHHQRLSHLQFWLFKKYFSKLYLALCVLSEIHRALKLDLLM